MAHLQIQTVLKNRKNDFIKTYKQGTTCFVVHNRPQKSNAYTLDMYVKAAEAILLANKDSSIKFIVVYSEGKNFSTGNDLANFMDPDFTEFSRSEYVPYMAKIILEDFAKSIITSSKPIFAIVQGMATGVGFTQLGLYDRVYAVEGAIFRAPLVKLAQGPEMCSSYTFPKYLGVPMAVSILIEGKEVTVDQLVQRKVVTKVKTFDQALKRVKEYIQMLDKLDYPSLIQTRNLMRCFERGKLLEVNQLEVRNLVERWLSPKLEENLMKYLEEEKKKRDAKAQKKAKL